MGGVVLLLLLLVITRQFNNSEGSNEESDVAELRKLLNKQKEKSEKLRISGIPGVTGDPQALVSQIKNDTEALARLVNSSESDATALRIAREDASLLKTANEDLRREIDKYQIDAARATDLQRQLDLARQASTGMISKSEYDRLRADLDTAKAEINRLRTQLEEMQN
jgi:hypothetical protein